MNGGGSYLHSGGSFSGPHQAQGEGRCSVLGITCGMRLAILKQGISAALARRVEEEKKKKTDIFHTHSLTLQLNTAERSIVVCTIFFWSIIACTVFPLYGSVVCL